MLIEKYTSIEKEERRYRVKMSCNLCNQEIDRYTFCTDDKTYNFCNFCFNKEKHVCDEICQTNKEICVDFKEEKYLINFTKKKQ